MTKIRSNLLHVCAMAANVIEIALCYVSTLVLKKHTLKCFCIT